MPYRNANIMLIIILVSLAAAFPQSGTRSIGQLVDIPLLNMTGETITFVCALLIIISREAPGNALEAIAVPSQSQCNREICKDTWLLTKTCCQDNCCVALTTLSKVLIGMATVLVFILAVFIYIFKRCTRPTVLPQVGGQPSVNVVSVNNTNMNTNNAASTTMMPMPMAYPAQPMYQYPGMSNPYSQPAYASPPPPTMQPPTQAAPYAQAPPAYQEVGTQSSPTSIPIATQSKPPTEGQGVKVLPTA